MENRIKSPEVSIILYIYEYQLNINYAIGFILSQTIANFELIVVSNKNKKIRDSLLIFNDKRIRHVIIKNKKQACVYEGIKIAQGKYICFASPNNAYRNDWLKHQIAFMERSDVISISGVCLTSYISDIKLIKVFYLKDPVLDWSSIIIKRCVLQEYESLFKEKAHISVICYRLAISILSKNENAFSIFNDKIFLYNLESYIDAKIYDQIRLEQIKAIGVRTDNKARLHSELFSFKKQNRPFKKYYNWVRTIENHNNGYYDFDFLSGLFNSLLCSKINYDVDTIFTKKKSDTIRILVICPNMEVTNPFISILINEINSDKYIVKYEVQAFWNTREDYDIIHIHWIEMLFYLYIQKGDDIKNLSDHINKWKQKGTKIIYTRHDEDFHYSQNRSLSQKMFDLVKRESDAIIHLGEYSKRETIKELNIPDQINLVIPHHIYDTIYSNNIDKKMARDILGIDKNSIVILAFGFFRNEEENLLVKEAFEQLEVDNKFLLAPSWGNPVIRPDGNVLLGNGEVDEDMLPYCFAASDIVFIQRVKILNSGNLPMAFFFNKVVVGPKIGNVGEYLDEKNNFSFDPADISTASKALYKAIVRINNEKPVNNEKFVRENWSTAKIVEQYKALYRMIISK